MLKKIMYIAVLTGFCFVGQQVQADLLSEWKFAEDAKDSVGDNHGKLKGNPKWVAGRLGNPGEALSLDGAGSYLFFSCRKNTGLTFGDGTKDKPFSIASWVKMNTCPNFRIVHKSGEYTLTNNNNFRLYLYDGSKNSIYCTGGNLHQYEGQWIHLVATYDGSGSADGVHFYVNGALMKTANRGKKGTYTAMENMNGSFCIGSSRTDGLFDDVRIYNHALSPIEVHQLFSGKSLAMLNKNSIKVKRVSSQPEVDGKLTENVWKNAQWHSDFKLLGNLKGKAPAKTAFAMLCDEENLYIGIKCAEPDMQKIKAGKTKHDSKVWEDDSVEIFLDSTGQGNSYYRFVINSLGTLYDEKKLPGHLDVIQSEWDSRAKVATDKNGKEWVLEAKIPFNNLSCSARAPSEWRFNIIRNSFAGKRKQFTYAPLQKSSTEEQNFLPLRIDADLSQYCLGLGFQEIKYFVRENQVLCQATILINNSLSQPRHIRLTATVDINGKAQEVYNQIIEITEKRQAQKIEFPFPAAGKRELNIKLWDVKHNRLITNYAKQINFSYTPFAVRILDPPYQNAIFPGQKLESLKLEVDAFLIPEELSQYRFSFSLKADKKDIKKEFILNAAKTAVSVRLPQLNIGDYKFYCQLIHKQTNKRLGDEYSDLIRILAPSKNMVTFDKSMACYVNNKRFVPFGITIWPGPLFWQSIEIGCNSVEFQGNLSYLDVLQKYNLKTYIYPYPREFPKPVAWQKKTALLKPLTPELKNMLISYVRKMKSHPAIFAWYIGNEPKPELHNPKTMQEINKVINLEDPYHPTIIWSLHEKEAYLYSCYSTSGTICGVDPYPQYAKNGLCLNPPYPTKMVQAVLRATKGRNPLWVMLQAYNSEHFGSPGKRTPTFLEMRNAMYQTIVLGAKGFFWYTRYWLIPEVKIAIKYFRKEVLYLEDMICAENSKIPFTVLNKDPMDIHLCRRDIDNKVYLITASSATKAKTLSFQTSKLKSKILYVVGENRTVEVTAEGTFTDKFKPMDTHIYTDDKSVAEKLNINEVYREIEEGCREIEKVGNLAHKNKGTKVTYNLAGEKYFSYPRCPRPDCIIDGAKATYWFLKQLPCWIEIDLPQPEKISKIVLDSNIYQADIEVEQNGEWKKVTKINNEKAGARRYVQRYEFPSVSVNKIKITVDAVRGGKYLDGEAVQIWECEIYR